MISVQEFCQHTTEVLEKLCDERAEYIIIDQGQLVAVLLPLESVDAGWEAYTQIAATVRECWPQTVSTHETLDEIRC